MTRRSTLTRTAAAIAAASAAAMLCIVAAPANAAPTLPANAANYVKYTPANADYVPQQLLAGANGTMWYTDYDKTIGKVSATGLITQFTLPDSRNDAYDLTLGPDGDVWFATGMSIGRITPSGAQTYYTPAAPAGDIENLTLGPDGNIWFSADDDGTIDKITPAGVITPYAINPFTPTNIYTESIKIGPDGNLWVSSYWNSGNTTTPSDTGHIGSITSDGVYTDHTLGLGVVGDNIVDGSDGNLWVSTHTYDTPTGGYPITIGIDKVTTAGQITPTTIGQITSGYFVYPNLVAGSDGNLWETFKNEIVKVTPSGALTPYTTGSGQTDGLASAPDGSLTFVTGTLESSDGEINLNATTVGSITTAGTVSTLYNNSNTNVEDLKWATDGHLWFSDGNDGSLAQLHPVDLSRVSGSDRYETALAIAKAAYPTTAPVVYVATGPNYPDALSAAPAAAHLGGPLLLTRQDGVPTDVVNEITSLAPSKIVVVGGANAVSDTALQQLQTAVPTATVSRIGGATRFATSVEITKDAFGSASSVFLATGRNFPDALASSSAAGKLAAPVILVSGNSAQTDSTTTGLITSLGAKTVYIAGGTAAVSTGIESQIDTLVGAQNVDRLQGANRYATSSAINHQFFTTASNVYVATGGTYADALAGAAVAGAQSQPLYLSQYSCLPDADATDIQAFNPAQVTLLGGANALSANVAALAHC